MKIFSNSQFDNDFMEYVFDPKKGRFVPKNKIDLKSAYEILKNSPRLQYIAYPTHDPEIKNFKMILGFENKVIKTEEGIILRQGNNEVYYKAVKNMIREAKKLTKLF